jgi:hypothetical protein
MITARLVGDAAVVAWLRNTPDVVAAGLARSIAKLGIELQRKIQEGNLANQIFAARAGSVRANSDLQVDRNDDRLCARVSISSEYAGPEYAVAGTATIRADLRRRTKAFERPRSDRAIKVRGYRQRVDLPDGSFLRAALEDMDPAIRDEVEAALRSAVTR